MNILKHRRVYSSLIKNIKTAKMKIENMSKIIDSNNDCAVSVATNLLLNKEVIAVPTDTIYGLACSANCPEAIKKLYTIKGRDSAKPVAICVSNILDVRKWGEAGHLHDDLLHSLLPGPVTLVLEKTKNLDNPYLNPHAQKIGIRIPNHEFINKLTELFDRPVALTSANFSNEPSSLQIEEFEKLYDKLGAVFNGGLLSQGLDVNRSGSTVIDLSKPGVFRIIRKGISYNKIVNVLEKHGLTFDGRRAARLRYRQGRRT